jgi:ADP-heptose:LPS heptosyltransferase
MCLLEGDLRTHGIEPDLSLWRYHCSSTEEQQERVDQWAGDQAYVLYHYLGHSCPEKKNLTPEDMEPYINKAIELGLKPVAMDWSGGDPFVADGRAKGIQEFWLKDPHSLNHYSDAGIIYEIIKNAEMLVGIDSGVEHIAGATSTPTAVIWRDFHPYFNFDPYVDEDRKTEDGYLTSDLTHFIKKGAVPLAPESQECFESLYAFKEYISPWELFETTLPKMLEEVVQ